jgi:TonB-linked SusC/RagA family outer membrane protein
MKIMRFNHKINQYIRIICIIFSGLLVTGAVYSQKRPEKSAQTATVSLKVVDDAGAPVAKANIVVGEGILHAQTDVNGVFSFKAKPDEIVTITSPGFERTVALVQDLAKDNTVKLVRAKLFMTSEDNVPLPYMTLKKRTVTGSQRVIRGSLLEKYPSNDLRNSLTGLVPGLQVTEYDGSTGITAEEKLGLYGITEKVGVSARGRGMVFLIDDVPVDITEMTLDPHEVETVTVIKDIAGKAMFGPIAADGLILIKTRRGRPNERILSVNVEDGVSVVDRFPGYVGGADYARLNNQARLADGLEANYDANDIARYAKNDPYDMYHPSVNFRDIMLKDTKSFMRANVSSTGGNDVVQYFSYLGYDREGDIYKIGSNADYNRINARSNIDMKINDVLSLQFDISAGLTVRRSPNYGYSSTTGEGGSEMDLLEMNSVLPDINNTPPVAFPIYANNDPSLKAPWYAVTPAYPVNPVANLTRNGYYNETGRKAAAKIALEYDMSQFVEGLKSRSFISFDALNLIRIGKAKDYAAYIVNPTVSQVTGNDTIILTKRHDGVDNPSLLNLHDYYYQNFVFFENLSYQRSFGPHNIQSTLTYFLYRLAQNGVEEPKREQLGVWTGVYTFNDKYSIQGVLNYAGTYSFSVDKRNALFPSMGASWIISEENFMSGMKFVNYLKLHAEAGVLGYESFLAPHLDLDNFTSSTGSSFGPYSVGRWFGTTTETSPVTTYPNRVGNPNLTWEKRKELSAGIDALLFDHKLSFELNYFNNLRDGQIVQLPNSMPYVAGFASALPRFNFSQTRYFGFETGLQLSDMAGKLYWSVGANATVQNSKIVKYDEPQYRHDYQFITGRPADTYWGQTYVGKFASDAEALVVPQLFDAVLKAGDLKYRDMNGDGVIDDNDESALGHTSPRLYYAANANIRYNNLELTVIGTGAAFFDLPLTNAYYWNGWGDNNYSDFVRDNIGGAYPRLTYYKVNNNFVPSDFWLTKGGYFKIQNIELAYTIPADKLQLIRSQGARFFIRGANLLTISPVKDVDPESINAGVTRYPLYRTFTGGIKLTF